MEAILYDIRKASKKIPSPQHRAHCQLTHQLEGSQCYLLRALQASLFVTVQAKPAHCTAILREKRRTIPSLSMHTASTLGTKESFAWMVIFLRKILMRNCREQKYILLLFIFYFKSCLNSTSHGNGCGPFLKYLGSCFVPVPGIAKWNWFHSIPVTGVSCQSSDHD